jgi:RNA polymerase sporulation-specific sigma factor
MAVCTDQEILTKMFTNNIRLAHFIAEKWRVSYPGVAFADVIQEAQLGLWKACRTYDPGKGAKFSTYAARCIDNQIRMFNRGMRRRLVREMSLQTVISTETDGQEVTLEDILTREDDTEMKLLLKEALKAATSRSERLFITYTLGEDTQRSIARELGLSQSYISRLVIKGMMRLRKKLSA